MFCGNWRRTDCHAGRLAFCLFLLDYIILGQACDPGWFGNNCSFMCHCYKTDVCNVDGTCINNTNCEVPYFGLACQYVNLIYWDNPFQKSRTYLSDNNDATCNPDPLASSVSVSMSTTYQLEWFRIHVNDQSKLMNLSIKLDDKDGLCRNERRFLVSDVIVEVMCEINVTVSKVEIEGLVAPHVCSLYVSLGRNVALMQNTNQSTNYSDGARSLSSNAVDGNTDQNYSSGSCSRTDKDTPFSFWRLFFARECILYLIRVFNRLDYSYRLIGFHVFTLNKAGHNVSTFADGSGIEQSVYNIVLTDLRPVTEISVWQADVPSEPQNHVLTLCELEAYGDTVCDDNTFGLQCERNCGCTGSQVCSPISGACTEFCTPGFFGPDCGYLCSNICANAFCAIKTGGCIYCHDGLKPPNCSEECMDGLYGEKCNMSCPPDCVDLQCSRTTGYCLLCKGARLGDLCEECLPSYYGELCEKDCPENCKNETCKADNGDCQGCKPGFSGSDCSTEDSVFLGLFTPIVLAMCVMLVAALILFLCVKMQAAKTRHAGEEQRRPDMPVSS